MRALGLKYAWECLLPWGRMGWLETRRRLSLAILLAIGSLAGMGRGGLAYGAGATSVPSVVLPSLDATPDGRSLLAAWTRADYRFTPEVRAAYLAFAKAQARRDLAAAGKTLPPEFLAWVDHDPIVESTVYGARLSSANVLLMLRSLELDLGTDTVRKNYTQLALAMAVVQAKDGPKALVTPHEPINLVIPGDPRHPVDTKDPHRALDLNDHIINFLNEHPVEDVPADHKWLPPASELVYDGKGVAGSSDQKSNTTKPAAEKKFLRPLTAADVMASQALQDQFNAYMKAHGQTAEIHCGDHVIYPDRHEAVAAKSPEGKGILDAFHLFRAAYEAKGLLPAQRDAAPTPAESLAFLIRNHECKVPAVVGKKHLPDFPLAAPWPLMTLLASDNQPLREREDLWERYHDKGELRLYGEYIGDIAQQFEFQSARRLCPYPFAYGTYQMMYKDGGVCGAMANMQVRTYEALGVPATTAGQPGHCALIFFARDPKTDTYDCRGAQFVTAGPGGTHPHAPWFFGDVDTPKPMVYHESIAWAINFGFQNYLDSAMAYDLFRLLPEADRKAHGQALVESALALNPYNFLLVDAGLSHASTPSAQIHLFQALQNALATAANKPGCPTDGLYNQTVLKSVFANLARLPVPADKAQAGSVYTFLQNQKCDNPDALALYQLTIEGLPAVLSRTQADFSAYLTSARTKEASAAMAQAIMAAAKLIHDKAQKKQWALDRLQDIQGHEMYFGKDNVILVDAAAPALAKMAGTKLRPESELTAALLEQITVTLKAEVAGPREPKACRVLAAQIAAAGRQVTDEGQKRPWAQDLAQVIAGHEEFTPPNARKNAKPLRDPCADAIADLAKLPATTRP